MANTTVGGVTLHDGSNSIITENSLSKDSSLAIMPLYLQDSDDTDVFDYGGVITTITLNGVYMNTSVASIKTWVDSVDALQQGHQDTDAGYPLTFTDDLRGAIKVKVLSFSSTFQEGSPNKISWTLKLVESSTNA